jgi:hypothetical protein
MSIVAVVMATRINKPLNWWRKHLQVNFFAKLWPWSFITYVIVFVIDVEIAIFGYPLLWFFTADFTFGIQMILALIALLVLMPVSIITAFASDIKNQNNSYQTASN